MVLTIKEVAYPPPHTLLQLRLAASSGDAALCAYSSERSRRYETLPKPPSLLRTSDGSQKLHLRHILQPRGTLRLSEPKSRKQPQSQTKDANNTKTWPRNNVSPILGEVFFLVAQALHIIVPPCCGCCWRSFFVNPEMQIQTPARPTQSVWRPEPRPFNDLLLDAYSLTPCAAGASPRNQFSSRGSNSSRMSQTSSLAR